MDPLFHRELRVVPILAQRPTLAEIEMSFRRSRIRLRVLLTLASLSEASPRALAQACGIDATRLRWVMEGYAPFYRPELSMVALGLAERVVTPSSRIWRITNAGRRKARQLTSRLARRAERSAARRAARGE